MSTQTAEPKIVVSDAGPALKRIQVTIPADAVDSHIAGAFANLQNGAALPGYRPGKAPMAILEKRFGKQLLEEARGQLVGQAFNKAVTDHKLRPIGNPEMSPGSELNELARGASFTFSVDIEVIPDFTLPAWEGMAIRKPVIDVIDKHIDDEILRNQYRFGTPSLIDGPFEHLDRMIGTVAVTVKGESEPFYKADNALAVVPAKEDEGKGPFLGIMIDDLQKHLMGRKVGDSVSFTAKGPEGHEHEKVRGNDLSFTLSITQAERITPAPVAELATKLGLADEAMLREQVKMVLEQRRDGEQQVAMREQVMEQLANAVSFDLPAKLSAGQITRDLERQRYELLSRGTAPEQVELKLAEARADTTESAQRRLKLFFILQRLAEDMRVDVTEGELNGRVAMIARQQNMRPAELRKELEQSGRIQEVALGIREAKVADRVIARATVTDVPAEDWNKEVEAKASARKASAKK